LSNRFTFDDGLEDALEQVEVPILGEVAGLEPAEPQVLTNARRSFLVAQGAFERARARERHTGKRVPKAVETAYFDTYNIYDQIQADYSWGRLNVCKQAGDPGPIQLTQANRFSKGFCRHP
jgi:hypothetical protein